MISYQHKTSRFIRIVLAFMIGIPIPRKMVFILKQGPGSVIVYCSMDDHLCFSPGFYYTDWTLLITWSLGMPIALLIRCWRWNIPALGLITYLLMPWLLNSPEQQQAWCWLFGTDRMYCCSRVNFIYLDQAKSNILIQNVKISFIILKTIELVKSWYHLCHKMILFANNDSSHCDEFVSSSSHCFIHT